MLHMCEAFGSLVKHRFSVCLDARLGLLADPTGKMGGAPKCSPCRSVVHGAECFTCVRRSAAKECIVVVHELLAPASWSAAAFIAALSQSCQQP